MAKNEILKLIKKNLKLSPNALLIIKKRYLMKNEKKEPIETPYEMFYRVAHYIAQAEKNYNSNPKYLEKIEKIFAEILSKLEFLPNSPTFTGAGTPLGQLAACFVLPVEDDMAAIMETLKNAVLIHKSGGGTGFDFSKLRREGAAVASSGGIASGPVSFMKMYNAATEEVKQGGTRRGANMGILRVDHPDIEKFIDSKKDNNSLNNFNISVAITDEFMKCLKKNKKYNLVDPHEKKVIKKVEARKIFNKIVENAWKNGEPGIVFIDEINRHNPTPKIGKIESTNPCGEQPLLPYESCNLGSINLSKFVNKNKKINWERLDFVVKNAVRFLDNVIDLNKFPLPEIEEMTKANRKIGLGVMGFADMLIKLEIPYNSAKALNLAERVMKFIKQKAQEASQELAKERGPFPNYKKSVFYKKGKVLRNATLTTIAPTGTISMIAQTSSGIEPLFAVVYVKNILEGSKLLEINPLFEEVAKKEGFFSKDLMEKVSEDGTLKNIDEIPEKIKKIFITAREISPEWHIKMQAVFQKYTDNAVSKTINFPNEATKEDIKKAYLLAYKLKLKGLTVYRDGSREEQVIDFGEKKKKEPLKQLIPEERPEITHGYTFKTKTSYGNLYITINEVDGKPFEVFTQIGKAGGFFHANTEAISRLISLSLRSGIDIQQIINQLKGIRDPSPAWTENGLILSLPDAIAKIMEKYCTLKQEPLKLNLTSTKGEPTTQTTNPQNSLSQNISLANVGVAPICIECGATLVFQEGCFKCPLCGYSKCDH